MCTRVLVSVLRMQTSIWLATTMIHRVSAMSTTDFMCLMQQMKRFMPYTSAGQRDALADFNLANSSPSGLTYADNLFYVLDSADEKVYVYTSSGQRVAAADFDVAFSSPIGLVYVGNQFYVLDIEGAKVHWYPIADPIPDLIVVSPSASNESPNVGESFGLSVAVRNQGAGSSAATSLRYYLSTDDSITTSDTQVGTSAIGESQCGGHEWSVD